MENTTTIKQEKLKRLVDYFFKVCSLCDELNIYEHEELDEYMQEMKQWVDQNFTRE
jgi:hypothetical protein